MFKLSKSFLEQYKGKQPNWGFSGLGYVVYKRSYARYYCKDCNGYLIDTVDSEHVCDSCGSKRIGTEEFWQTCKRVVEGTFELQRRHVELMRTRWNNQKAQKSAQEMFKLMWEFKFLPPGRGLWAMGTPLVMERNNGAALLNCLAGETEVITKDGIKQIQEIAGTEQTLLTSTGKWVEAPIKSFGVQSLMRITLKRSGTRKIVFATPDHRWFARKRRSHEKFEEVFTKDLEQGNVLRSVYGMSSKTVTPDPVGIQHGIVFGDGSGKSLMLCGKKDAELLEWFPKHTSHKYDYVCAEGGIDLTPFPKFFKKHPDMNETRNYLLGWLMGYFAADGTCKADGSCSISSKKKENLEFVKGVCAVLGIGTYSLREESRISNLTNESHTMYILTLQRNKLWPEFFLLSKHRQNFEASSDVSSLDWVVDSVEETDRIEEVFCAVVPDTHDFVLADNILTGNCGYTSTQEIDFDFPAPFCFLFEASAHGVGIGFDTRGAGKATIVEPKMGNDVFIVEDSREGWSALLRRVLLAYVGKETMPKSIDYSLVRPFGAPIKTFGGTASGPQALSELIEKDIPSILTPGKITSAQIVDVMNVIGKCVVAGGARRSSEIALGDIDDQEFITLKLDKEKLYAYRWNSNNTVYTPEGFNNFEKFVDPIMDNGEPGFYFLHNAQRYGRMADPVNNLDQKAIGVNPCFTGEMTLLTESGYKSFFELEDSTVKVVSRHGRLIPAKVWKSGTKPTVFVNLYKRDPLHCTPDHVWMTTEGPCEAQNLEGKRLKSYYTPKHIQYSDSFFAGFIQGDGHTGRLDSERHLGLEIKFNEKDSDVMQLVGADTKIWYSREALNIAKRFNLSSKALPEREFPDYDFTEQELSDFLTGVFSANGSVIKHGRVALKGTCKAFIDEVKAKLAQLGIDSYITINKPTKVKFANGEYLCKQSYDLNICRYEELLKFAEKVNFAQTYKRNNLQEIIENKAPLVTKVVAGETEDVFDFAMEEDHWGVVNGYIAHNCGEQTLESYELCNIAETFPANCESLEDYLHAIKYAYLYTKTVTLVQTPWARSNEIMLRNRRIGLSMSGIVQNINKLGFAEHIRWCDEGYKYIQDLDKIYSEWLCIRQSIKTTTVKPSGCRPAEGLVTTDLGLFTLSELVKNHPEDASWCAVSNLHSPQGEALVPITQTYRNGEAETFKIGMAYNVEVESTADHEWWVTHRINNKDRARPFTINAWVKTKDLRPDDVLEINLGAYQNSNHSELKSLSRDAAEIYCNVKDIKQPTHMTPDFAWLLGYLWGDGAMSAQKKRFRWVDSNIENLQRAKHLFKELFNLDCNIHKASENRKAYTLEVGSSFLWEWFLHNGIFKYVDNHIDIIPQVVRCSAKEDILAFLSGLIDSDGCVHRNSSYKNSYKLTLSTSDAEFAKHIQDVALSVGLLFSRSHNIGGKNLQPTKSMWLMTLSTHVDDLSFDTLVKHSFKLQRAQALPSFEGWSHKLHKKGYHILGKIKSVESAGVKPTFDIETESHWYYAGAVKSHNSVSLLTGATPGIHYPHSQYYIRRVRFTKSSPMLPKLEAANYPIEQDKYDKNSLVVSFPVKEQHYMRGKKDINIWEQLENAAQMQAYWSDNSVSITVEIKEHERGELAQALTRYQSRLKTVSFLPPSHTYEQAPYEEIPQEEYESIATKIKPLNLEDTEHEVTDKFCDSDVCQI